MRKKVFHLIVFSAFFAISNLAFYSDAQAFSGVHCFTEKGTPERQLKREWKALNVREKKLWRDWARKNPVLVKFGMMQYVNAEKAFEIILNNRSLAGESLNTSIPPRKPQWFSVALSLRDAGPFTENTGYMGFRADMNLESATTWFVCATPLGNGDEKEKKIEKQMQFIKTMSLSAMERDELTPSFAPEYRALFGSFNSPKGDGEWWTPPKYIWFQSYQYFDGQLAPGQQLKGRIQVEL